MRRKRCPHIYREHRIIAGKREITMSTEHRSLHKHNISHIHLLMCVFCGRIKKRVHSNGPYVMGDR